MQSALSDKLRAPQIPGFWSGRAPGGKDKLMHLSKGLAYSLRPKRILDVLPMCLVLVRECIKPTPNDAVPDGAKAAVRPDGLCGIAHDLEPDRLKQAYSRGLFPWNHIGPVKWWAPRERALLFFDEFKAKGFTNVRIPVCWHMRTQEKAPYKINETFMKSVEQMVDWFGCWSRDIIVQITYYFLFTPGP